MLPAPRSWLAAPPTSMLTTTSPRTWLRTIGSLSPRTCTTTATTSFWSRRSRPPLLAPETRLVTSSIVWTAPGTTLPTTRLWTLRPVTRPAL